MFSRFLAALTITLMTVPGCTRQTPNMGQTEGRPTGTPHAVQVATARHGLVTTDAPLATEIGLRVLQQGGNAIDAAIATAFALAVVYPEAGNVGGGGFLVARFADGRSVSLDFREVAPLAATRDMFLDSAGNLTDKSLTGHLASGVPGAVAGLWAAHQRFGSRPWPELISPAIELAERGFEIDEHFAAVVAGDERLARFPASAALFLPNGVAPRVGTRWRNSDLAAVLRRIAEHGAAGFYEGETADLIVAEMQRGGGLITHEDLKRYQPKWREPLAFNYRGHRVISMAPASSGGITLGIMSNILEGFDLGGTGAQTPETLHLIAEASRRAFADRNHYLGDADFVSIPTTTLLSAQYAQAQRATIDRNRATPSSAIRPGMGTLSDSDHTTHFSIVDAAGNAVALTTTINELHGSAVTVTGAGFLLNDEMDDFTSKVGVPNLFGLVQGEANAIVPAKRMLSAMTPTIVVSPTGQTMLVTGARGGPRIISAVFQILSNIIDHRMSLADAVVAPRIHHQHLPDVLYFETNGLAGETVRALEAKGHRVQERTGYIGSAPTILRVADGWQGMPDPRQGGLASGY